MSRDDIDHLNFSDICEEYTKAVMDVTTISTNYETNFID